MTADEVMRNWADWHCKTNEEINNPTDPDSLAQALAVDRIVDSLHYKEQDAVRGRYLKRSKPWTEAALHTGMMAVEEGLRAVKLI